MKNAYGGAILAWMAVFTVSAPVHAAEASVATTEMSEAKWFSRQGALVFSAHNTLSLFGGGTLGNPGGNSQFWVSLGSSADYFVLERLSIGAKLNVSYNYNRVLTSWSLSGNPPPTYATYQNFSLNAGPRIGYNFILAPRFSLWPTIEVLVGYTRSMSPTAPLASRFIATATIEAPFIFHVTRQFFVGLGPSLLLSLNQYKNDPGSPPSVTGPIYFGLSSTLGAAF